MKHLRRLLPLYVLLLLACFLMRKKNSYAIEFSNTSIMYYLSNAGLFNQFSNLLVEAQADTWLSKVNLFGAEDGFTVFAPTDKAFFDFSRIGILRDAPEKRPLLEKFIKFHIVPRKLSRSQLRPKSGSRFDTLAEKKLDVNAIGTVLYSVEVSNGVIYVVDKVLVNPDLKAFFPEAAAGRQSPRPR